MKTIGQNKNYPGDDTMVMQNYFYLYAYYNWRHLRQGAWKAQNLSRVQAEMGTRASPGSAI